MIYSEVALGFLLYNYSGYFVEILLCVLQLFGIRSYIIIGDKEKYKSIVKRLEKATFNSSYIYRNGKSIANGYFIGTKCIGHYDKEDKTIEDERIRIITTEEFYQKLIEMDDIELNLPAILEDSKKLESASKINVFIRNGTYKCFYYRPIKLDVSHITPIGAQGPILNNILDIYNSKRRAVVFIHGVTMAGKSSIGYLLAKELGGNYCHTFNPIDPGDSFNNLISEIDSHQDDDKQPLVIVIEEVNEVIRAIHNKTVKRHDELPTQIKDKSSWCSFLDDMIFYKDIVVIFTSNESNSTIDELDPAYLRNGRIDATYSMMEQLPSITI